MTPTKDTEQQIDEFSEALALLQTKEAIREFLKAILSDKEITMISNRLAVIKLLNAGKTQREASQQSGVASLTTARAANALRRNFSALEPILQGKASTKNSIRKDGGDSNGY